VLAGLVIGGWRGYILSKDRLLGVQWRIWMRRYDDATNGGIWEIIEFILE